MLPTSALALAILVTRPAPPAPAKDQPVALYAIPLTLPAGPKAKLTLRGTKLDTATEVKADTGMVKLLKKGKASVPNNYPAERVGDTEVEVEIELQADFSGDTVRFSVITPGGTTEPLTVVLGKSATAEKEPNDSFDKAQPLTLPATIDGTIGREKDTDLFTVTGKKGQKLTISASSFGSPTDLLLTVYDANKQVLLVVDDVDGKPDPSADLTLPADGVYFIALLDASDLGGSGFGYRLTVK
jgi:hypothetical protein